MMITVPIQARLAWYARLLLKVATIVAKYTSLRIPHRFVLGVCCRSWRVQMPSGSWHPVRITYAGRIVR